MDSDHCIELLLIHIDQELITQNACVVDNDVQVPESLHCPIDQTPGPFPIGNTVGVSDCLTTSSDDLINHPLGKAAVPTRAIDGNPWIVYHDPGSLRGEEEGMLSTDALACTSNDGNSSI